ncbi:MAG: hypothetical protein ABIS67_14445 [Candidatus Eisenbacteria bacterium]
MITVVLVFCAFANGPCTGAAAAQDDQAIDLTGLWTLNGDLSDDPTKVMQTMQAQRHDGSGGGGWMSAVGFGVHGPGMHGGGGGGPDPEQMRAQMNRMTRAIEPPGRLTITQTNGSITLTDAGGQSQTLTTKGKKERLQLDGRTVSVRTKWDHGRLVKKTSLGDGMTLTETYSLVSEPRQLHVRVKLDSSHLPRPVNFSRAYDREGSR